MKCTAVSNQHFFLNYGWEHFWCDPKNFKNFAIREFVKGPFEKPKLVYPIPYVTFCQQDGSPIRFNQGIPDCWTEYLTCDLRILRQYFQNYELMHKRDVDIVRHLRKNYRLYIGQGIPDPWTKYPFINASEFFSLKDLKGMTAKHRRRLNNKLKDEACFCCQKKYLFECPDKCETNSRCCSCKNCHSENTSTVAYNENCKCFGVLQNCLSRNAYLKPEKKRVMKTSSDSSFSSLSYLNYSTENDDQNVNTKHKSTLQCGCNGKLRTVNKRSVCDKSDFMTKNPLKFNLKSNTHSKEHSKMCFCPYVKKALKSKDNNDFTEPMKSVSKLIQVEVQPIKFSKTVQTENLIKKQKPKCECSNKCFQCSVFQCKTSRNDSSCLARHSFHNFGCTPSLKYCPGFLCPLSNPNHPIICKTSKDDIKKIKKKNKKSEKKEKENEPHFYQQINTDKYEFQQKYNKRLEFKENKQEKTHDEFNSNKNIYFCLTSPKTLDHSKYTPDDVLKYCSTKKESFMRMQDKNKINKQPPYLASNLEQICKEGKPLNSLRPDNVQLEKFKKFQYFKPNYSEFSFHENYVSTNNSKLFNSNIGRINHSDQATMFLFKEKKNVSNKVKYSKEKIKSSEFSTGKTQKYGGLSKKTMKKRRKLLTNRKRRKKLASSGKVLFREYQAFLNKINKPELVNKHVQVETSQDNLNLKKVPLPSDYLNLNKSSSSILRNSSLDSTFKKDSVCKKINRDFIIERFNKFGENAASEESLKQPLQSELQFGGILEKISYKSGSTWSSNTLKNIVNDLLTENNQNKSKTQSY